MENILKRGYTLQNSYAELYWKFPKFLLKNDHYKKMKDSSKIAYMLFKDRINLAIKNNWYNENGIIYLLFSQKELMDVLNCYQGKVRSTLTELEQYGLLEIQKGQFNPSTGKNEQNRYFLLQPEYQENDVYFVDNTGYAQIAPRDQTNETLDNTGYAQIAFSKKTTQNVDNTGYAQIAQDRDISIPDTLKEDTEKTDTKKQQQDLYLLENFAETYQDQSFLNYENLNIIGLFSDTLTDAENMQGIILRAKKAMEKEHDAVLVLDNDYMQNELLDVQKEITKTLRRIYQKRKTDSTIKNIDNYAYGAFKNLFDSIIGNWKILVSENQTVNTITTHDWVN